MAKLKPTAEQLQAEVKLQLSQRRFVLEAVQTGAQLLQVPLITAGLWYYLSSTNPTLGVLNKAILAAELAPIVGDIKFPEGVLLGAAMESTDDLLKILEKAGLLSVEGVKEEVENTVMDTGQFMAEFLMPKSYKLSSCEELNLSLSEAHLAATKKLSGPWDLIGALSQTAATVSFGQLLLAIKDKGCPRPTHPYYVSKETWESGFL